MDVLHTMKEVTANWKISEDTVARAIKKGDLEGIKMGSEWRFTDDQLEAFLKRRTVSRIRKTKMSFTSN